MGRIKSVSTRIFFVIGLCVEEKLQLFVSNFSILDGGADATHV